MKKWTVLIFVSFAVLGFNSCQDSSQITVIESDEGYLFRESDSPILFYQRAPKSFNGGYTRNNYIHPLWTLDGEILTEDGPEDHLHQRGVFWAWHQTYAGETRLGDAWACSDFIWDVTEADIQDGPGVSKILSVTVYWKSPDWTDEDGAPKPVVEERTRLVVHPAQRNYRAVDVEIGLRALERDVTIGGSEDEKGYGGFSARIKMPEDLSFMTSGGQVEPQTIQVEAGPWIDFSGTFGQSNQESGLAILVHPSNPGDITKWILRKQGSMQNPVFPGREPVTIPQQDPILLKYRLIIHRGSTEDLDLEALYQDYAR
jgi:hypothetical protein